MVFVQSGSRGSEVMGTDTVLLMSALQLVENILDVHTFVFFGWERGVSPFRQLIAIFTSVSFFVCLKREGKCRIP